jgi:hypothetical protein
MKMDLGVIGRDDMDWIGLVQDRDQWRALVNIPMNSQVPQNLGKLLGSWATGGLSGRSQLLGVRKLVRNSILNII